MLLIFATTFLKSWVLYSVFLDVKIAIVTILVITRLFNQAEFLDNIKPLFEL